MQINVEKELIDSNMVTNQGDRILTMDIVVLVQLVQSYFNTSRYHQFFQSKQFNENLAYKATKKYYYELDDCILESLGFHKNPLDLAILLNYQLPTEAIFSTLDVQVIQGSFI